MWKEVKRRLWDWRGVLIATPSITGLVLLLRFTGLLQAWEWAAFDQYMRLRPQMPPDDRVLVVGINESDVSRIGQPIIPDGIYADLIEKLKARKPRAIGLDIYRDLPVEPGHRKLVQIFESTPNLVGIQKVVGRAGSETVPPPPALKAKGQVGANDLIIDADNKVRRSLLSVDTAEGEIVYSFGLHLALHYLLVENIKPVVIPETQNWSLGKTTFSPFESNDGGYVRADAGGYQLLLNYRGAKQTFETVSMTDVLTDKLPPKWGHDRVILIGTVGESFQDAYFTPYSSGLLSLPERMPGVEIHANITSQIISAALDGRALIKSWAEPAEWLWIFGWAGVGGILAWQLRYAGSTRFSIQRIATPLLGGLVLLGCTYGLFAAGWWIPVIPPLLSLAGTTVAITIYIALTAGQIRKTFGRYLSDEIVATLLESPEGLSLGGERRKITILTSDLRGFTATSDRMPPEEVIKIINFYLKHMADVITRYQGTIDEFMGDGILVLFGAPTRREDDAERAIACAVGMQLAMAEVNQTMRAWGLPPLEMGIGINTGEVVVGNIGSEKRTKYGVVGSQINLTYRIESYSVGGQILLSESTLSEAGASLVKIDGQRQVKPKGVQEPITIYEVGGIGGKYNLSLPKEEEVFLPLTEAILIHYSLLDGKDVGTTLFKARCIQLSARGALVECEDADGAGIVAPLTNIKLNLLSADGSEVSEDVYAKVLETPAKPGSFYILFTAKPPAIAAKLETLYQSLQVH
jgi:adenylate cyclase